jgi:serine/threonine protein kinase
MPSPTTGEELLDLVRKSNIVDEGRLTAALERLRAAGSLPAEPPRLATQLLGEGVLTHFQAEQFLQGKWRHFLIGWYKVLERLGAGNSSSVYLCEHIRINRRVAVKVLPASLARDSASLERFYREARALAAVDHPNIIHGYDIDQEGDLHFLVLEHVDGSSLEHMVSFGPLAVPRAAHYIRQAALGLHHAHESARLVHRNVTPEHVFVNRTGIVKVIGWRLALVVGEQGDYSITQMYEENVLGTADYLAPEQAIDSHGVDIRADIYSLGATFYYCLTGKAPFPEGSVAQKLIWHQTRQPRSVQTLRPDTPDGIAAIIHRMMAKEPGQRFQTMQEVADALAPWIQTPIPPPPENEMPSWCRAVLDSAGHKRAEGQ